MTAADFRDLLKRYVSGYAALYAGKYDRNKQYTLCVYSRGGGEWQKAMTEYHATRGTALSVLVHWNKNYTETEQAAQELFETIEGIRAAELYPGIYVDYVQMNMNAPEDLHTDENGVYERIIDITVFSHVEIS